MSRVIVCHCTVYVTVPKGLVRLANGSDLEMGLPRRGNIDVPCKLPEASQGQHWTYKGQTQGLGKANNRLRLLCYP